MKTVAIIGAGASGLTAIKCCLEDGLQPICFERTSNIGGLWYYTDEVRPGQACVAKSTVTNTSKEITCFSDYPMPDDFPNYLHNRKVIEYLRMYADRFDLSKYIQFNVEVLCVKQTEDFDETGHWLVETQNKTNGKRTSAIYDAVLVGNGHFWDPLYPDLQGKDIFQGKIIHGKDFRDHRGFEDKRVVIIGLGNTGGDVAADLSKFASQVYVSTARGTWMVPRLASKGLPMDNKVTRLLATLRSLLPSRVFEWGLINMVNSILDHEIYSMRPAPTYRLQQIIVNDELPVHIICGSVIIKSGVSRLTENGVHFDDGTYVSDVDVIICTTGYLLNFPFLDESIVPVRDNAIDLYRLVFPPQLTHPTLAVIGVISVMGAAFPLLEMQCRWATKVVKGTCKLPTKEAMCQTIKSREKEIAPYCKDTYCKNTLMVQWVPYLDELAKDIGCKPNIGRMFMHDPVLAWTCFFGPCRPYQFRLVGPGSWSGARDAILTSWQRMLRPLKTRPLSLDNGTASNKSRLFFLCGGLLIVSYGALYINRHWWY